MKVVLFLGAGFSHGYGLPTMKDFFGHVQEADYLKKADKAFLQDYQRTTRMAAGTFETDIHNIEDVLSFCLASENFAGSYPEAASENYKNLCRILCEVYRRVNRGTLDYWNLSLDALKLLLGANEGRRTLDDALSVITTNYDIVLEYNLWRLGLACYLPTEWGSTITSSDERIASVSMYTDSEEGILLCKLHGSVNWYSDRNSRTGIVVANQVFCRDVDSGISDGGPCDGAAAECKRVQYPQIADPNHHYDRVPLIVPPTFFKLYSDPRFENIWIAAGKALREAEKIVFIGYSFPPSDTHIQYFLGAHLYDNMALRSIETINPTRSALVGRFGRHIRELSKGGIGCAWEHSGYSITKGIVRRYG